MPQHKTQGFTLVELIVVVTILAILATIWFVSYSSYLTWVRDTNRIAQLTSISDWLNLYSTKNDLPIPDNNVEVSVSWALIAYQGTAGANTLDTIDFSKWGKDPKDDTHFSYYLTKNRKYFQLMAFLEESENLTSWIINSTHAIDYTDRIPTVSGKKLGILTNNEKVPLEQLWSNLDLALDNTTDYIAYIDSDLTINGDTAGNSDLANMENIVAAWGAVARSCKELLGKKPGLKNNDWAYMINPGWQWARLVYCDMTTDGGGWTFFLHVDWGFHWTNFFEESMWTYMYDRTDTWEHYSLSSDIFEHTEMMMTKEAVSPATTSFYRAFQYEQWHSAFNKWPVPCVGLTNFSYKTSIDWVYSDDIETYSICWGYWYVEYWSVDNQYVLLFHWSSWTTYWNYLPSAWWWQQDWYWYLR